MTHVPVFIVGDMGVDGSAATRASRHEAAAVGHHRGQSCDSPRRRERSPGTINCGIHCCHHLLCKLSPSRFLSEQQPNLTQLPLSFFATLFGMNAKEFNEGYMALSTQLIYMCKPLLYPNCDSFLTPTGHSHHFERRNHPRPGYRL